MRRFASPLLVLLSASSLLLGACSKDSSDTTAAANTEAPATDAAVETTAAEATEAVATEAVATDASATEAAAGSDAATSDALMVFLGAIGAESTPETIACLNKEVPGISSSIESAMNADYPPQPIFKAMITCTPDAIFGGTAQSIVEKTPEVTEEQSTCLAISISGLLADKSEGDYNTLAPADGKDWPQAFRDEIVAGTAECGVDTATLTKVIEAV